MSFKNNLIASGKLIFFLGAKNQCSFSFKKFQKNYSDSK